LNNTDSSELHLQNGKQFQIRPKSQLGTAGVMMEAFNIIQDRIARARMAGDPPDYTVRPRLQQIGLADFHKADESIAIGYKEATLRIGELKDAGSLLTV
jgi:NTE family protein